MMFVSSEAKAVLKEELIALCGMNCSLCISYQARLYDFDNKGFKRKHCPGCRPRGEHCLHMRDHCDLIGKGQVHFCFDCENFPCKRLKSLDKRYRTKYHLSMIENLILIRDKGIEAFLAEEESKWKCPDCGSEICCHNGLCLNCNLTVLQNNRKYRWGEA